MNREDKIKVIQRVIDDYQESQKVFDTIHELFGDSGKVQDSCYGIFDHYLEMVEIVIEDSSEWLEWFIYENVCGERGFEAGYDGKAKVIKTVEDLVDLIEEGNNRK